MVDGLALICAVVSIMINIKSVRIAIERVIKSFDGVGYIVPVSEVAADVSSKSVSFSATPASSAMPSMALHVFVRWRVLQLLMLIWLLVWGGRCRCRGWHCHL